MACVSIPAFELQLLIKQHPGWQDVPAVVITEAKPLGRVVAANRAALRGGVRPDMRYAQALSLRPDLQAAVISPEERQEARETLRSLLYEFSPAVEIAQFSHASLFWLDVRGFSRLYSSYTAWGQELLEAVRRGGFLGSCAVGFSRLGTFAAARKHGEVRVFESAEEEERSTRGTPVRVLPIAPFVKERLGHLGVERVEEFLSLPEGGVRSRFGRSVDGIYALSSRGEGLPVQGREPEEPNRLRRVCIPGVRTVAPILEHLGELLDELCRRAKAQHRRVRSITLRLRDESGTVRVEELTPAEPTLDPELLGKLCELRLSRVSPREPVEEILVEGSEESGRLEEQDLFLHPPNRRPEGGRRALALLRAKLGESSVLAAELLDGHLPERRFLWRPFDFAAVSRRSADPTRLAEDEGSVCLVRRILPEAKPLGRPRGVGSPPEEGRGREREGRGGPFILSTRWWLESVEREYRYVELPDGGLGWVYREGNRWFLQGRVE
ncbi:MAG: hypothetical protein ACLFP6_01045 [Spirochaetaceae bacterium]